jgi:hypothetical protein
MVSTPISPDWFVWFELIPCSARILDRDGLQIRIGSALRFADTNVFSMVSINSVPVFRSGGAGENKWLVPSDLVYDKTACIIWRQQSILAGITDPFQTITVCDLLRIGIKQIIIAAAKTNNQRQKRDAPERAEQIVTPHFRQSDWKRECVLKIELAIIIESPGPLARKIAQDGLDRRYFTSCRRKENP